VNPKLRRPLVAGNWKLYKTQAESIELATAVSKFAAAHPAAEVAIAPIFTALSKVADALRGGPVGLSAQDVYWAAEGAFTGEVGTKQLVELGCRYVIVGHSERRQLFGETDETVQRKTQAVLAAGLIPIVCVGETLAERDAGQAASVVIRQLKGGLQGLSIADAAKVVIAYEPVWAIGTGKTASPKDAQEMHAQVRASLADVFNPQLAAGTRVLYGGSVKPDNAVALLAEPDLDGALVGGASLTIDSFGAIISAAAAG
jgi:triosephosphate isomerase